MKLPIEDGDSIIHHGLPHVVAGSVSLLSPEPICFTYSGFWFRRRDGKQMTALNDIVMTAEDFRKWERNKYSR